MYDMVEYISMRVCYRYNPVKWTMYAVTTLGQVSHVKVILICALACTPRMFVRLGVTSSLIVATQLRFVRQFHCQQELKLCINQESECMNERENVIESNEVPSNKRPNNIRAENNQWW